MTLSAARDNVVRLSTLASGDEKHEASSESTLDVLLVLYERVLRVRPAEPEWPERDRFLLSKGHGPAAFYAVLAHSGFFPESWLPGFMTHEGRLGGHPDRSLVPGVEISSGSLGHGLPMAAGVALALRARGLAEPRVFVLTGDAELNEGSNWEAVQLAAAKALDAMTLVVVDNHSSSLPMTGLEAALAAFGWASERVDGRDHAALERALRAPRDGQPNAVIADVTR